MRVVLDSNVILAALAARGICSALFEYCVENHEVVICAEILEEVDRALSRKVRLPRPVVRDILGYLRAEAQLVSPLAVDAQACRDRDDAPILGAALSGGCSYIITGDRDLLSIGTYSGVHTVTPRQFWESMKVWKGRK